MFNISNESLRINERFFEALDILKRQRRLSGIYGFALKYNAVLGNLYNIKNKKHGIIKAEYLSYLVRDFGFSARWLLTGEGNMFNDSSSSDGQTSVQCPKDGRKAFCPYMSD